MLRFGTDGVRGVAFTELSEQYVSELGKVAARELGVTKVLIGRDTRESGKQLETALANGLLAGGVTVELLGVAPTPAIAFLAAKRGCASAAITASHNPYLDNGVKLFANGGVKLSDAQYRKVKAEVERWRTAPGKYYDLERRNCIHFVGAMAEIVGIRVDYPRSMLRKPRQWLDHLSKLNPWLVPPKRRK